MGEGGGTAIAKALERNTVLTTLNLGCELILIDLFRVKRGINHLACNAGNELGEGGGTAIAQALESITVLTTLNLEGSMIVADLFRVKRGINYLVQCRE